MAAPNPGLHSVLPQREFTFDEESLGSRPYDDEASLNSPASSSGVALLSGQTPLLTFPQSLTSPSNPVDRLSRDSSSNPIGITVTRAGREVAPKPNSAPGGQRRKDKILGAFQRPRSKTQATRELDSALRRVRGFAHGGYESVDQTLVEFPSELQGGRASNRASLDRDRSRQSSQSKPPRGQSKNVVVPSSVRTQHVTGG